MYWISQAGVSIWLSSYWISVAGVEEAESILCTAWPHKHPHIISRLIIHLTPTYNYSKMYLIL